VRFEVELVAAAVGHDQIPVLTRKPPANTADQVVYLALGTAWRDLPECLDEGI
jgi:hypothetical protein